MSNVNHTFAWFWILTGLLSGASIGMFFHDESWLGGYASWRRRMVRLGHISFLGTGLLNLGFALSAVSLSIDPLPQLASLTFLVGAVTMPTVCFLSAWHDRFRHMFFIPVASLIVAVVDFLIEGLLS
tara:strand:- start:2317 stop:2697 length:381 start_codon:yes stop_codon:yes gene_type:complete